MELASLLTEKSYSLIVILGVLMMILRSNPKIKNWAIQWIILATALVLSFCQEQAINIDVILNAFVATGICLFGENAIYRKKSEKTKEEEDTLNVLQEYKKEVENERHEEVDLNEEIKNLLKKDKNSDNIN